MKVVKYLYAFWAGILVYAALAVLFGASGLFAYRQLERDQRQQEANIESLMLTRTELENTTSSLIYDRDLLAVYAREQGYAASHERFIRIVGLGVGQRLQISPGELISAGEPQYIADTTLRIIALCTGLTLFLSMLLFDILKNVRE
ncbi:MAG: septum formation initiator family protein [Treponema sp.]|nr:septum formation initiator family protein [Treponema sp.]